MTETCEPYEYEENVHLSGVIDNRESRIKLKIREGLRLVLAGLEDLWGLPRSFETKRERGKDKGRGTE